MSIPKILIAIALLIPAPALAWEAGTNSALCTLRHEQGAGAVLLTFDPGVPLYTIAITGTDPWDVADTFAITFDGPRPNTITTQRHVLTPDLETLSVADRGFGNVLDGLQFNTSMTARSGASVVPLSLESAAPAVEAFRACGQTPSV